MGNALIPIRDARSIGEFLRSKSADGFQFSLEHDGSTTSNLWGRAPDGAISAPSEHGTIDELQQRRLRIARQTGFSGGLSEGDKITITTTGLDITGNVYLVDSWETENDEAVYVVLIFRRVTRRSDNE